MFTEVTNALTKEFPELVVQVNGTVSAGGIAWQVTVVDPVKDKKMSVPAPVSFDDATQLGNLGNIAKALAERLTAAIAKAEGEEKAAKLNGSTPPPVPDIEVIPSDPTTTPNGA